MQVMDVLRIISVSISLALIYMNHVGGASWGS